MQSIGLILQHAAQRIGRLDARWLVSHVCKFTHAQILSESNRLLTPDEVHHINRLVQRRAGGEPLAYILGEAGFFGRMFKVSPAVLVPRPETEDVVERALSLISDIPQPRILDLGTGSGAIAITLSLERPDAKVIAVDLSADALMVGRSNAARLNATVEWRQGDWFKPLKDDKPFDLIVSNPPYIAADDPHLAGDGVCVEPRLALTDGADGLDCLRKIIDGAPAFLNSGCSLLLEHGHDQGAACRNLLNKVGFQSPETWVDLTGNDRMSSAVWVQVPVQSPKLISQHGHLSRIK
jgi:release factor glutamine methyltransferase